LTTDVEVDGDVEVDSFVDLDRDPRVRPQIISSTSRRRW
jgi:hypothetical protein